MTTNKPVNRETKHKHRTKVNSICLDKTRRGGRAGACGRVFHIFVVVVNLLLFSVLGGGGGGGGGAGVVAYFRF